VKSLQATKTKARVEIQKEVIHLVSIVAKQAIHHSNAGKDHM
jgi:hypothetical protein